MVLGGKTKLLQISVLPFLLEPSTTRNDQQFGNCGLGFPVYSLCIIFNHVNLLLGYSVAVLFVSLHVAGYVFGFYLFISARFYCELYLFIVIYASKV